MNRYLVERTGTERFEVYGPDGKIVDWFAFASNHMRPLYPDGVIAFWPADDSKATKVLDNAVKNDRWKWHPQYDPKTGLTCGRLIEPDKKQWRARVEKGDEVLWETVILGTPSKRYYSWDFWGGGSGGFPAEVPKVRTACQRQLLPRFHGFTAVAEVKLPHISAVPQNRRGSPRLHRRGRIEARTVPGT